MCGNREMDGNRKMGIALLQKDGQVFRERWFQRDGSFKEMCGNGNKKMGGFKEKGDNRNMGILQCIVDC